MTIKTVYLVASGDFRESANKKCWERQSKVEESVTKAFKNAGVNVIRAHNYDKKEGHGFICSQKMGMEVFTSIPKDAAVIAVEAVWQYTYHILPGLYSHEGPILTIANFEGEWPGLVGLLNLNASLTKAGKQYSSLWSVEFSDAFFVDGVKTWIDTGIIQHDMSHVGCFDISLAPSVATKVGQTIAATLKEKKAILGVFDEGCMGMYNAIIPDELLMSMGIWKERLSQSALYVEMQKVSQDEAKAVKKWLDNKGMTFVTGPNEKTDLTERQILEQCQMYIAAVRMSHKYGCSVIGIQYQIGLVNLTVASDLVEGLMNNVDRPPVYDEQMKEIFKGKAVPHFNEVDEGAAVDLLVTNRVWTALGLDPASTLHDIRWGDDHDGKFTWVMEISGSAPPSHFHDDPEMAYKCASSERQPPMYFPLGGGSLKGECKTGHVVWSRVYVQDGKVHFDIGLGEAVAVGKAEMERRWKSTTSQWPIMNLVTKGVSRDQMMAKHKSNHVQVAYGKSLESAIEAAAAKAACFRDLGCEVHVCGDVPFKAVPAKKKRC